MKFELDVSGLDAGSIIEQSECERLVKLRRDEDKYEYQFRLLQLVDFVSKSLRKDGRNFTVVQSHGAVCVLTHEQASKYNAKTFRQGLRRSRRSNRRLMAVDVSYLSEEARAQHVDAMIQQSRIMQSISRRATDTELIPVARSTPKI